MESVINDVELLDLAVIPTDGGPVMHMMRPASPLFGETILFLKILLSTPRISCSR